MAIDNIQFINCSMPKPLGPGAQCSSGQFMCKKYRFCVSKDAICNYKNDCGDESDEMGCNKWTRCNFEYSSFAACGIKTDNMEQQNSPLANNVEWNMRRSSSSPADVYNPRIDSTLRTGRGMFLVLETLINSQNLRKTFTSEFYSPMMTSQNGNSCRMRFFYFINGEPVTITNTHLDIFIRFANKRTVEATSILNLKLNIRGDLQQRWNFAVVQFQSQAQPFQFVFRGALGTNLSRVAVDDISFDPSGCLASTVKPLGPTTPQPVTSKTDVTTITPVTVTSLPKKLRQKPNDSPAGPKIAAGILVPLFVILSVIGAYFGYQRYQKKKRDDDTQHITMSMKNIQEEEIDLN